MPETKTQQAPETESKQPFLGLSLTQLVGGGAAAATAALLGSRLGTTGTIIGAAVASIVSAVASALYTASLARTRQVVVATREILPGTMTLRQRADLPQVADQPEGSEDDVVGLDEETEEADTSPWSRVRWKPVLIATAAVFVIGALLITGIEAVTGQSLSGSGRSTFDSVTHTGKQPRDEATRTPSESPSEDTSTSTTPTPSESTSPSASPSGEPTDEPTDGTSTTPTPTPTPTSGATSTPTP